MSDPRIGKKLAPYKFTVERGKIKEFAEAIGDPNPIYVDPEAAKKEGYKDIIAPPTYGTVIDFWGGPSQLDFVQFLGIENPLMVLHGEEHYEYYGEINPGDEITVEAEIEDVKRKEGGSGAMDIITYKSDYKNQRGELVLVSKMVIVERGK